MVVLNGAGEISEMIRRTHGRFTLSQKTSLGRHFPHRQRRNDADCVRALGAVRSRDGRLVRPAGADRGDEGGRRA